MRILEIFSSLKYSTKILEENLANIMLKIVQSNGLVVNEGRVCLIKIIKLMI